MPNRRNCGARLRRWSWSCWRMLVPAVQPPGRLRRRAAGPCCAAAGGQWSAVGDGPALMEWQPEGDGFTATWTTPGTGR